ncbi:flagellar hook-basal body complex protein [Lacipirellula parvula]|uniref:Flagellar hook protein FlgE n=1 Tax=Lacipirellula parvula TaxID=2650471 RepID=A0A5K7XDA6_9BACT|nr:flagellar hook-basal body complex protein [Lacipirellula parvula]BBO34007.1 flagellar hook protein FlgE [Lacipirellula parvula]
MGLQSALATALTGMTAAETTIDVAGNNVANANTVGFKESSVNFATQFLQTQSIGSAPTTSRGGTNPRQIGLGSKVAEITPDFTSGTIEISSNPLDLAIQGDGFFIVQGSQGEQLYTRNGQFKTNGNNEIVTLTGHRVLGYSVDANFTIQPTGLSPIQIPLGAAAVAQATENVTLKGALNPNSTVGTIPEVIQSGILSDGSREHPTGVPEALSLARPSDALVFGTTAGANIPAGTYQYRIAYVDSSGNEGPASNLADIGLIGGVGSIDLSGIAQPSNPDFTQIRIYRNNPATNNEYRLVTQFASNPGGPAATYSDNMTPVANASAALLQDDVLGNNSYSYYVTFVNSSTGAESRPTARFGPVTADSITQPRIRLDDIPQPSGSGEYDKIKIYRNVANNPTQFYEVAEINQNESFIDSVPDADIVGNPTINLDGPSINFGMKLVDVVSRNGADYNNLFGIGELTFSGDKGGRQLAERTLNITANTTVQDLLTFMDESMGVLKSAPETTFPDTVAYGGTIVDSRLQFTSNMGIENALSIDLSAFKFKPANGVAEVVQMPFSTIQEANGEGATADFVVYDSLGTPINVRVTTVLESIDATGARFRWIASSPQNAEESGVSIEVGTGVITTDGDGKFVSATDDRIAIGRGQSPANSPLEFKLDFNQVTGLAENTNTLAAASQDGFPSGTLTSFIITESGRIQGVFSNGSSRDLGQLRMARFANNGGLQQVGDNMFAAGVNSGLPIEGNPGGGGMGAVSTGAVELSNTDIGQNLIELILASTQYRGGARVITAVQELLDELLALRR